MPLPVHGLITAVALCLSLFAPPLVHAGEVRNLYRAEIPVQGQTSQERSQATRTGLLRVLVRVTGKQGIEENQLVQQALASPFSYVQQFRYRRMEQPQVVITDAGTEENFTEWLRLDFDEASVNMMLRQAGLPLWGRARPSILLWIAVEDLNQRRILGGSFPADERKVLETTASDRGIPVLIPLMDLQDQADLNFADIWGDFQDTIRRASERYQPGGILVGRVYRHTAGEWEGRWTLYQGSEVYRWLLDGKSREAVLADGLGRMADTLGEQFAQVEGQQGKERLTVTVSDIQSLEQYARAMKYLESLDVVDSVKVTEVGPNHASFLLSLRGQSQSFRQATVFGETLAPDDSQRSLDTPPPGDVPVSADDGQHTAQQTTLYYRLLP